VSQKIFPGQKIFDSHTSLCASIGRVYTVQLISACKFGLLTLACHCFEQQIVSVVWLVLVLPQTINHRTVVLFIYQSYSIELARNPLVKLMQMCDF